MDDVLNDALSNLVYDNYERGHKGYKSRQADVALIRAALAAQPAASVEPVVTAAMVRAAADELGKQTHPWTACVRDALRAALAAQPAASAEPSDEELARLWRQVSGRETLRPDSVAMTFARALLSRYGRPAGDAQPVGDHKFYPHPGYRAFCQKCGKAEADHPTAPVSAQKADDADPLQGAADWLGKALEKPRPTDIASRLLIGHNRAERLFDAAIAQQRKGE